MNEPIQNNVSYTPEYPGAGSSDGGNGYLVGLGGTYVPNYPTLYYSTPVYLTYSTPVYLFYTVGENLYKVNPYTGEAWVTTHNSRPTWVRIEEEKPSE